MGESHRQEPPPSIPIAIPLDSLPGAVAVSDSAGRVVDINDELCRLLGADRSALLGRPLAQALDGRAERIDTRTVRHIVHDTQGTRRWLQRTSVALERPGFDTLDVHAITDISEFESRRRGRSAAISGLDAGRVDAETGVLNRLAILQELHAEVSRSRRYGNALSALLVRIGAPRTDVDARVLGKVVEAVNQNLRWVDSVGRIVPSELLVVLPETDEAGARRAAAKIETDIERDALPAVLRATEWGGRMTAEALLAQLRGERTETAAADSRAAAVPERART